MISRTKPFVIFVVIVAIGMALLLPSPLIGARADTIAISMLLALALIAELLPFVLPKGASAATSSMPIFAAVLIVPSWPTVAAAASVKAVVEIFRRREPQKAVFNVAQYVITFSIAVLVYVGLGGESLLRFAHSELSEISVAVGLPAFAAFAAAMAINTMMVSVVIALSTNAAI